MKKFPVIRLLEGFCILEFILMVIVVFLQVIFRYVVKISVPWTEELARVLYIGIIFLGIALVERDNINIRTTYFIEKLPTPIYRGILVVSNILSIILLIMLFIGSITLISKTSVYYLASMPFLKKSIFYVPLMIGAPIAIVMLMKQIKELLQNKKITEGGEAE